MKYHPLHPLLNEEETILATFWQRLIAFAIDATIAIILTIGTIAIIEFCKGYNKIDINITGVRDIEVGGLGWVTKIIIFLPTIYFALLNYFTNGKTIGKSIMRIRIVSLYHPRIGFWHCVERALGYTASLLELGLGFLQIFWNPNRMCLHDRIAETIVIREKKREKKK